MLLTQEQYSRGYLDGEGDIPEDASIQVDVRSSDNPNEDAVWHGPYGIDGSVVDAPPGRYMSMRIGLTLGTDPTKSPNPRRVRWERDGRTVIYIPPAWVTPDYGGFQWSREFGTSCRLVVRPKSATWTESFVLINRQARIRFSLDPLRLTKVLDDEPTQEDEAGNISVIKPLEDTHSEGPVVEILVTARDRFDEEARTLARDQAYSVLGMLALCLGDGICGEILTEEFPILTPGKESADITFQPTLWPPVTVARTPAIEAVDAALVGSMPPYVSVALRWYLRGIQSDTPADAFISYFVGLEALASGWFTQTRPSIELPALDEAKKYFGAVTPKLPKQLVSQILNSLGRVPLNDRFGLYWSMRVRPGEQNKKFGSLAAIRNSVLHGSTAKVTDEQEREAAEMLRASLAAELSVSVADSVTRKRPMNFALNIGLTGSSTVPNLVKGQVPLRVTGKARKAPTEPPSS